MTWCVPWAGAAHISRTTLGPENGVVVIPAGTVDPNNDLVSIDVQPLVTPGGIAQAQD